MGFSPAAVAPAQRPFTRVVLALDALVVAGSVFLLVWVTALGRSSGERDAALVAVLIDVALLVLVPGLRRMLPVLPWLPLTGGLLMVTWQLLTAARIDRVETGVVLALVALVALRQLFTGLDNVRLVRGLRADQDQLLAQAFNDSLTGLSNRAAFDQQLSRAIRAGRPLGLIFCDLDDFKAVNDRLGHAAGDDVLRAVATRLRACVRPGDMVARLGGDEFAVLLEEATQTPDVIGRRIVGSVGRPFQLVHRGRQVRVRIGASVGVAVLDRIDPTASPESLLAEVDQAMYAAKRRGKNQLVTFRAGAEADRETDRYLPLFDPARGRSTAVEPDSRLDDVAAAPDLPQVVDPVGTPVGADTPVNALFTPAARYRGAGRAQHRPPAARTTQAERRAQEQARLAAAAQRSMDRTLAEFEALEKEGERREAERTAAQRRAFQALEIEAEVRAGSRTQAEVIPLSRAVAIRAQKATGPKDRRGERHTGAQPEAPEPGATESEAAEPEVEPEVDETEVDETGSDRMDAVRTDADGVAEVDESWERAEQLAALSSDHIDVLYRPVHDLRSARLCALAVSVRWRHPAHGVLTSESLLTAAEQVGLRRALEERVLDAACAALSRVRATRTRADLSVHLPLAGRYLADDRLVTALERALRRHDLPGRALVLLITGEGPMPRLDSAARVLERVHTLGVRIGVDRFGAGLRDLELLRRLPVDLLALDPGLTGSGSGERAAAVLAGVRAMTPGLDLSLHAQDVNLRQDAERLAGGGIDLASGELYGPPVTVDRLDAEPPGGPAI